MPGLFRAHPPKQDVYATWRATSAPESDEEPQSLCNARLCATLLALLCCALGQVDCRHEPTLDVAKFVSPQYPFVARVNRLMGSVSLRIEIGADGRVLSARGSGRSPILVEAAERNVRLWQFNIPKAGSLPVVRTIAYDFRLVGKPSLVGLTTVEFIPPSLVRVVDQPAWESAPEAIPPEGIPEPTSHEPRLLQLLRECYVEHCANQSSGPIDQVPLRELIDCYSKHCERQQGNGQ